MILLAILFADNILFISELYWFSVLLQKLTEFLWCHVFHMILKVKVVGLMHQIWGRAHHLTSSELLARLIIPSHKNESFIFCGVICIIIKWNLFLFTTRVIVATFTRKRTRPAILASLVRNVGILYTPRRWYHLHFLVVISSVVKFCLILL